MLIKFLKLLIYLLLIILIGMMVLHNREEQSSVDPDDYKLSDLYLKVPNKPVFSDNTNYALLSTKTEEAPATKYPPNKNEYEKLLNKIIECESNWQNVCNGQYGCRAGQGIVQLIPTTVKTCEGALGKKIDPFNKEDSLECAWYLLTETNQSYHHWGYPDNSPNAYHNGIRWGSYNCFKDYIF